MSTGKVLAVPESYIPPEWPLWWSPNAPRSAWLVAVEAELLLYHPDATRTDLSATARSIAPFPLADPPTRAKD